MPIELGPFAPDIAGQDANVCELVQNALPLGRGYGPANDLASYSEALDDDIPRTILTVQRPDLVYATYVLTDVAAYRLNDGTLDDVTNAGGAYAATDRWSGTLYGSTLLCATKAEDVQSIDVVSGSNFVSEPTLPKCGGVTTFNDVAIYYRQVDNPRAITWSDVNNYSDVTNGLADTQEFPDGGEVMHVSQVSRLIIQESMIRQIIPTGTEEMFNFQVLAQQKGTIAPHSCIQFGPMVAFYSQDGFKLIATGQEQDIGRDSVDEWFREHLFEGRTAQIQGALDPRYPRLWWAFPTADADINDMMIGYDWRAKKWCVTTVGTYALATAAQSGMSIDSLDSLYPNIDEMNLSLDSPVFQGGKLALSAIGGDKRLSYFEGDPLATTIRTSSYNFGQSRRSMLSGVRPILSGAGVSARVNRRQTLGGPASWTALSEQQMSGKIPLRADGFWHQIEFTIPAGTNWNKFSGFEPFFTPSAAQR